jgi:23S rRNA (uridine2552-2'-O)-methyltransferase
MSKPPKARKSAPKSGKATAKKLLSGTDKAVAARKAAAAAKLLRTKPGTVKPVKGAAKAASSGAPTGATMVATPQKTILAAGTMNAAKTTAGGAGATASGAKGRSLGGHVRVLTARKRSNSSTRWLARQLNDPYVKAAKAAGYRSRAAYKLLELDEQFGLFAGVSRVIDLGAAPGGWCQAVLQARPKAHIVAIDLLEMAPMPGVTIFQKDILDADAPALLRAALGGGAQLVLSDMAANTVGHKPTDHIRTMALVESGLEFAVQVLGPGGAFVAKVLAGGADPELVASLKRHFTNVRHAKPPASRKGSSEWYVVAQGFKGQIFEELPSD